MTKRFLAPFEDGNMGDFETKIKKIKKSSEHCNGGNGLFSVNGEYQSLMSDSDNNNVRESRINLFKNSKTSQNKSEFSDIFNNEILNTMPGNILYKQGDSSQKKDLFEKFRYFNIFKGKFKLDLTNSRQNCESSMFTCAGQEFIRYFSEIPDNLLLSTKLAKRDFIKYMDKALIHNQKQYLVLPGWVQTPSDLALKSEMQNRSLVLSMSYSSRCKLFLLPKSY